MFFQGGPRGTTLTARPQAVGRAQHFYEERTEPPLCPALRSRAESVLAESVHSSRRLITLTVTSCMRWSSGGVAGAGRAVDRDGLPGDDDGAQPGGGVPAANVRGLGEEPRWRWWGSRGNASLLCECLLREWASFLIALTEGCSAPNSDRDGLTQGCVRNRGLQPASL